METLKAGTDTLFILLGAIMVLAMHAGFAFLELGTVRKKNQVNALVKILVDFSVSTVAYFFIGYAIAYGVAVLRRRRGARAEERLRPRQVLLPAHVRRGDPGDRLGRHRRARALRPAARRDVPAGRLRLPVLRGHRVEPGASASRRGSRRTFGAEFHDFAGTVVVHAMGGWIGLVAVLLLGARRGRYSRGGRRRRAPAVDHPVPRARRVDPVGRLVRLQRDERADDRQDLGARRGELADGDGGRHASPRTSSGATTRASCTTARSPGWSRSARAPT